MVRYEMYYLRDDQRLAPAGVNAPTTGCHIYKQILVDYFIGLDLIRCVVIRHRPMVEKFPKDVVK